MGIESIMFFLAEAIRVALACGFAIPTNIQLIATTNNGQPTRAAARGCEVIGYSMIRTRTMGGVRK